MKHLNLLVKYSFILLIGSLFLIVFGLTQGSALVFSLYPFVITTFSILVLVSIIQKLIDKRWILSIAYSLALPIVLIFFYVMFYPRDIFFSSLTIPPNVPHKQPIEFNPKSSSDYLQNLEYPPFRMELIGGMGRYKSIIWTNLEERGKIFLRGYDAIHNFELERISERTEIQVSKPNTSSFSQEFTVYDGVWGKYYLARFELWFAPENGTSERKIGEQIFKIDGWIR